MIDDNTYNRTSGDLDNSRRSGEALFDEVWKDLSPAFQSTRDNKFSKPETACSERGIDRGTGRTDHKKDKAEWTVVVDISTGGTKESEISMKGSKAKEQRLAELAEESKGKPVTIVVQSTSHDGKELERFALRDGIVTRLPNTKSEGVARDLESVLDLASTKYPSKKIGVVLHGHGMGNPGMVDMSARPDATPADLAKAIKNGLKHSEHQKLDLLDFDACTMAQNGAIGKLRDASKHVVASQKEESAISPQGNGQNQKEILHRLLNEPEMDSAKFAETVMDVARAQKPDIDAPIKTLSHYDLEDYSLFKAPLDKFGAGLAEMMKDPDNRREIENIIKETKTIVDVAGVRDLKDFVNRISQAIDEGRLKAVPGMKEAAANTLASMEVLLKSKYGHEADDKKLGGLSVYLPDKSTLDTDPVAERIIPSVRLDTLSNHTDKTTTPEERKQLLEEMRKQMQYIDDDLKADKPAAETLLANQSLKQAWMKMEKADVSSAEAFNFALKEFNTHAKKMAQTNYYQLDFSMVSARENSGGA